MAIPVASQKDTGKQVYTPTIPSTAVAAAAAALAAKHGADIDTESSVEAVVARHEESTQASVKTRSTVDPVPY